MNDPIFSELIDAHYAALYRFALSLARSPDDAGDLTQQTFYIWATKGSNLRDPEKAKTWLFTTLYREFLRKRRRDKRVSSLEDLAPGEREPVDQTVDDLSKMDREIVMEALQELDPVFRAPVTLFYLQDHSYQEIAQIIGAPIGTIMSRIFRGKACLREALVQRLRDSRTIEFPSAQPHPVA